LVKTLKFFYADPRSNNRDGKNSDPGSGIQDGKNFDLGSGIRDGKIQIWDPRSGINIPDQQNWKSCRQIYKDLKNRIIIEPFVEKAFWDETKSFLKSKVTSVALKREKTPVNWIFQSPTRHGRHHRTRSPGEKPLLQLTFIRP
jgi:hypothetical protein